jgi:hypothetical protein
MYDIPDHAAHYHTLGPKLEASFLTRHLAGLGVKVAQYNLIETPVNLVNNS